MDSLTQIVLGASVAAAIVPAAHRRAALAAGAVLGTLPDLDGIPIALMTDDPVLRMTMHRGLTHSLLVLPLVAAGIWWLFKRFGKGRVAESPVRWFWAIALALITHPLLDAFTVYGTQLFWPFRPPPAMWSSVFIIDPLYTVWLLIGVLVAACAGPRLLGKRAITAGLVLSTAYLGWSLVAKTLVEREAERALVALGLGDAPRFSVQMPANTLLWRVVAMTDDGYVEGFRSLAADRGPMRFTAYRSGVDQRCAAARCARTTGRLLPALPRRRCDGRSETALFLLRGAAGFRRTRCRIRVRGAQGQPRRARRHRAHAVPPVRRTV